MNGCEYPPDQMLTKTWHAKFLVHPCHAGGFKFHFLPRGHTPIYKAHQPHYSRTCFTGLVLGKRLNNHVLFNSEALWNTRQSCSAMEDILKLDSPILHTKCTWTALIQYRIIIRESVLLIQIACQVSHDLLWIVVYYTGAAQGEGLGVAWAPHFRSTWSIPLIFFTNPIIPEDETLTKTWHFQSC